MVFSSAVFLFIFLPVVLFLHTVVKNNMARNVLLIIASLVFYAYGEPVYIIMLLASVAVNYVIGHILEARKSKPLLVLAIILNISLLFVYKYADFVIGIINCIPGARIPKTKLVMPIGISFFTFQAISYIVDTYRAPEKTEASFWDVLLYISLFPQLIAGPIVKYNSVKEQIRMRTVSADKMADGIRLFVVGLAKKMLIANAMGSTADTVFGMSTGSIGTPLAWLGAVCYMLQIYFDFSGYSDMAVGLGRAMGFEFPQNFDHPYVAVGIRSFWRRWHMSLTGWFREYVYIPLGGNRCGKVRQIFNSMVVFLLTGIWHGANFTFILWGVMHGVLLSVETAFKGHVENGKLRPLKWLYTVLFVCIGFVIFRSDDIVYAFSYIGRMFAFSNSASSMITMMSLLKPEFIVTLVVSIFACTPIIAYVKRKSQVMNALGYVASFGLYFLCVLSIAANSYNPFIYFRF